MTKITPTQREELITVLTEALRPFFSEQPAPPPTEKRRTVAEVLGIDGSRIDRTWSVANGHFYKSSESPIYQNFVNDHLVTFWAINVDSRYLTNVKNIYGIAKEKVAINRNMGLKGGFKTIEGEKANITLRASKSMAFNVYYEICTALHEQAIKSKDLFVKSTS